MPSNQWISAVIILAGAVFLVLAVMGLSPIDRTGAEELYRTGDGPLQALDAAIEPNTARWLRAAWAATAVLATAFAARRFLHDEGVSVLAAGMLLLDPSFLVHGRLATPVMPAMGAALLAFALFLSPERRFHWVAATALGIACFMDPGYLMWSILLGIMVLTRGHIYAAPQHALVAGIQTVVIPLLGVAFGAVAGENLGPDCYVPVRHEALFMLAPVSLGANIHWHANPAIWIAGIIAVAWLGIAAAATVLGDFRLQRLPGRIQVRLSQPLRREQGRALWLLALVVVAPPALWLPLFTIAIGGALLEFRRDARRFAWGIGIGITIIALVYVVRLWPLLIGAPGAESLLETIPWASPKSCT